MDRRYFVSSAAFAIAALGFPVIGSAADSKSGGQEPIVETTTGKVRGVDNNGVYTFKGIPYGASTAGASRFMPPRKMAAWAGVRDCLAWGPSCPQGPGPGGSYPVSTPDGYGAPESEQSLLFNAGDTDRPSYGEDCLVANVWTRGPGDGKKRPVMVWMHGGGFTVGSGSGGRTDGTNLARNHDVVSVSLNHRLGVLGYTYLGDLDRNFAASGNVGQLDLIAALEWVRDNIEAFGGDPKNVTLHGQSGGGSKIHILMAMPAAKGLFHRAICRSGIIRDFNIGQDIPTQSARERATEAASALLKEAGLGPNQIGDLQRLPIERLYAASMATKRTFGPVVGTADYPELPNAAIAKGSARMPFIVGCTLHEAAKEVGDIVKTTNEEELLKRVTKIAGPHAAEMIASYRKNHPDFTPGDLLLRIMSDGTRFGSIKAAEAHIQGGGAPTYMYLFAWESPRLPIQRATHGSDDGAFFGNTEALGMSKGLPEARQLSVKMSTATTAFARSGNPSNKALGDWPPYTLDQRATMVFNTKSQVEDDPMGADRIVWERIATA